VISAPWFARVSRKACSKRLSSSEVIGKLSKTSVPWLDRVVAGKVS